MVKWYKSNSTGSDLFTLEKAAAKCRVTYANAWAKFQAKAPLAGSACVGERFVDNGNGTVTDKLTWLVWEKKTSLDGTPNDSDPHDADNYYSWSLVPTIGNGTAFTDFLRALNAPACFAGTCDWRLPTRDELQTILTDPWSPSGEQCPTPSCINAIFGPTQSATYLSYSIDASYPALVWGLAWTASFGSGNVGFASDTDSSLYVRAVHGGL